MNLKILLLCLFFISSSRAAFTKEIVKVLAVKGEVYYANQKIKTGDVITQLGKDISTKESSMVKLLFNFPRSIVTLGPNSIINLNFSKSKDKTNTIKHLAGTIRYIFSKKIKQMMKGETPVVQTKSASFGVRGTDFMSVYNPLLNESEIVVFKGRVHFQSLLDKNDEKTVPEGYWGGIGGRYRSKIGDLIKLPQTVLSTFDKLTSTKTLIKNAKTSDEFYGQNIPAEDI